MESIVQLKKTVPIMPTTMIIMSTVYIVNGTLELVFLVTNFYYMKNASSVPLGYE